MDEHTLGMQDMLQIFDVTDELGIDREQITVPLEKEDPGSVARLPSGKIQIVAPATVPDDQWTARLRAELEALREEPTTG